MHIYFYYLLYKILSFFSLTFSIMKIFLVDKKLFRDTLQKGHIALKLFISLSFLLKNLYDALFHVPLAVSVKCMHFMQKSVGGENDVKWERVSLGKVVGK